MYKENATKRYDGGRELKFNSKSKFRNHLLSGRHLGEDDGVELPQRLGEQVAVDEDKRIHRS